MKPIGPRIAGFFRQPLDDVQDAMTALLTPPRGAAKLALLAVLTCATWFVYVPIHELLHVLGCVATGGTVTELQMQPVYGARWLAEIFPFIVPGGDLAGRLSGFEDYGSDFTYLSSAFAPYLPSLLLGVPLLRSLLQLLTLVVELAAARETERDLREPTSEVKVKGNQGKPLLLHLSNQASDLPAAEQ